jgi:hypothetical protein
MLLVLWVTGQPDPVHYHRYHGQNCTSRDARVEITGVGEEEATESETEEGNVESCVKGAVEVGGDTGVDVLIEVDLGLVDLPYLLLAFQQP